MPVQGVQLLARVFCPLSLDRDPAGPPNRWCHHWMPALCTLGYIPGDATACLFEDDRYVQLLDQPGQRLDVAGEVVMPSGWTTSMAGLECRKGIRARMSSISASVSVLASRAWTSNTAEHVALPARRRDAVALGDPLRQEGALGAGKADVQFFGDPSELSDDVRTVNAPGHGGHHQRALSLTPQLAEVDMPRRSAVLCTSSTGSKADWPVADVTVSAEVDGQGFFAAKSVGLCPRRRLTTGPGVDIDDDEIAVAGTD